MKFGMPSRKVLKYGLHFLILSAIIVGMLALFMGTISLNIYGTNPNVSINISGDGSYFEYLRTKNYISNYVGRFNAEYQADPANQNTSGTSNIPGISYNISFKVFSKSGSSFSTAYKSITLPVPYNSSGIIHKTGGIIHHNAGGILPTPALGPGPVMPSSGSLAANNS